jgi:hypothetical protein
MVVVEVAGPGLEGEQVAVLRLHAASAGHATKAAYSCGRQVYVPQGTKYERPPRKRRTSDLFNSEQELGDLQPLSF